MEWLAGQQASVRALEGRVAQLGASIGQDARLELVYSAYVAALKDAQDRLQTVERIVASFPVFLGGGEADPAYAKIAQSGKVNTPQERAVFVVLYTALLSLESPTQVFFSRKSARLLTVLREQFAKAGKMQGTEAEIADMETLAAAVTWIVPSESKPEAVTGGPAFDFFSAGIGAAGLYAAQELGWIK